MEVGTRVSPRKVSQETSWKRIQSEERTTGHGVGAGERTVGCKFKGRGAQGTEWACERARKCKFKGRGAQDMGWAGEKIVRCKFKGGGGEPSRPGLRFLLPF